MRNSKVFATLLIIVFLCPFSSIGKESQRRRRPTGGASKQLAEQGKVLFAAYQCLDCHKLAGKGCIEGVTLDGVGSLRSEAFLRAQLSDPEKHVAQTFPGQSSSMPKPYLSSGEMNAVVAYLKTLTKSQVKSNKKI